MGSRWWIATACGLLLTGLVCPARAGVAQQAKRLNLGPYGRLDTSPVAALLEMPRFDSSIDVVGRAPRDPNRAMAVWWKHFDIEPPAIYGRGIAFRQPPPPGSVDIVPLIEWIAKKVKKSND
jgi:hypothetical protein